MGDKDFKIPSSAEVEAKTEQILKKMKEENLTMKEAMGLSDSFLEEIYSLAHSQYERGSYEEALSLFRFLAGCSPGTHKFTLGLASTLHQMEQYGDAIEGFRLALEIDPQDPLPIYYIADCFFRLNMKEEAAEYYKMMVELGEEFPEYSEIGEKSRLILQGIQ